jgi:K(+)-stimulated pyrophosphate-energized sodium pump
MIALVVLISVFSLGVALQLARGVLTADDGTPPMRAIADAIKEGAEAFLRRQNRTIFIIGLWVAGLIFVLYAAVRPTTPNDPAGPLAMAVATTLSFAFGALCSGVAGYVGMFVSIRANLRTASAARSCVDRALRIALRGGAVSGVFVVAMSLLGVGGLFAVLQAFGIAVVRIPFLIVGYGFGASLVALFAQLAGGIYTKAADVGADLVGKVEAGIPEDDPRNPAVIADLVGDNVGDCAGRGADLFESTAAENIGAMILAAALATNAERAGITFAHGVLGVMMFPLVARAFGLLASIAGVVSVRTDGAEDPMAALNRGYYLTAFLAFGGFVAATRWLLHTPQHPTAWLTFLACGFVGIVTAQLFVFITEYYTDCAYRPVQEIAKAAETGPATTIISGMAVGMECTAVPTAVISAAILLSFFLGRSTGIEGAGLFGTAVATMGMLATAAYVLAMDTFGPITDNAGGIVEMSNQPEEVRHRTDRLDAVGNTTKALTKGYAIGSAALAAFLLFSAYLDEVRNYGSAITSVDIAKPDVWVGGLLGAMLVFLFSALAIRAVGRAAYYVINDVRDQFHESPGILDGSARPDYGRCVDIVTRGALREMVIPGVLAVTMPIAVGVAFKFTFGSGAEAVASLLMVGTMAGILLATMLNNGGGAWDNAKKYIEMGHGGGKGSDAHRAAVVGDTVGDPFKDTAGPSIHVLIKLLSTITLVMAPLFM